MPFTRETVRHELVRRSLTVSAVTPLTPSMVRITVSGAELDGFRSLGPSDHVKLFFPDRGSGSASRDYTPRAVRLDELKLDLDFVVHGDEGPATAFASQAAVGDELTVGGPRGSRLVPDGIRKLLIVADETAFPMTARWLELLGDDVEVTALLDAADESVLPYFTDTETSRMDATWLFRDAGPGQLEPALRALGPIEATTYVVLAGEAGALVPLRRYLRGELGLPPEQLAASGYWRRGVAGLDHHAPLDPTDPD